MLVCNSFCSFVVPSKVKQNPESGEKRYSGAAIPPAAQASVIRLTPVPQDSISPAL